VTTSTTARKLLLFRVVGDAALNTNNGVKLMPRASSSDYSVMMFFMNEVTFISVVGDAALNTNNGVKF